MKRKFVGLQVGLLGMGICLSHGAQAKSFFFSVATSSTQGNYSESMHRKNYSERDITASCEYLDKGGLLVGYGKTAITMINADPMTNTDVNIDQRHRYMSGRINFWPDFVHGRITWRVDGHQLNNNDVIGQTDGVKVVASQLGWLSSSTSLYFDLGYAESRYPNQDTIQQYTPTIGVGFDNNANWIQLRGYQISGMNPATTDGKTSTSALDMKWTHYLASRAALAPSSLSLAAMVGERIFAVDMDSLSVANLADLSNGAASILLDWEVKARADFSILIGKTSYRDVVYKNDYSLNTVYANFTLKW